MIAASAGNLKKVFLELGGKSAAVVLDDADIAGAAAVHRVPGHDPCRAGLRHHHAPGAADGRDATKESRRWSTR